VVEAFAVPRARGLRAKGLEVIVCCRPLVRLGALDAGALRAPLRLLVLLRLLLLLVLHRVLLLVLFLVLLAAFVTHAAPPPPLSVNQPGGGERIVRLRGPAARLVARWSRMWFRPTSTPWRRTTSGKNT